MHTIRLRAAWTSLGGGRYERRFNRPTGLADALGVRLAWDGPVEAADLNGRPVSPDDDLADRLAAHNTLVLATDDADVLRTVRLEVEEA